MRKRCRTSGGARCDATDRGAQAHDAKRLEEQFQGKMEEIGAWGIAMDAGVAVPCTAGVIGEKAAIAQMLGGKDVPVQVAG